MRRTIFLALLTLAVTAPNGVAGAQETSPAVRSALATATPEKTYRLTLKEGSQLLGRILSVSETSVQFESSLGVSMIPIESIASIRAESGGQIRNGQYYFSNPNATRLIFSPTGRMLAQGEGYFSDYWVFFPGFSAGLTNRFTIGGGLSLIPGIGFENQLLYFTPKVGIVQQKSFNAAVGALFVTLPSDLDEDPANAGILYGVGTWGSTDNSFTTGLGYGFLDGRLADRPMIMLGGEARASPRVSFVTENYVFPGGTGAISGGLRFMGRDASIDFALAKLVGPDDNVWFPFLGVVWKW